MVLNGLPIGSIDRLNRKYDHESNEGSTTEKVIDFARGATDKIASFSPAITKAGVATTNEGTLKHNGFVYTIS